MKSLLKLSIGCLIIAIALRLAFDHVTAQQVVTPNPTLHFADKHAAQNLTLSFHFSDGEQRTWLTLSNHDPNTKDFHPSLTSILCDYKPVVRKRNDGKYQIQFTSEIAEDLP